MINKFLELFFYFILISFFIFRAEEAQRASQLYAAFGKYISSIRPNTNS